MRQNRIPLTVGQGEALLQYPHCFDRLLDLLLTAVFCVGLLTAACTDSRQHAQLADRSVTDAEAGPEAIPATPPEPVAAWPSGPGPTPVFRPDEELLIFELRWKDVVLNEAMIGYLDGARVLLPLGETLQSLDFPISVDLGAGFARGWFLEPNRLFHLDVQRQEVIVDGRRQKVPANMAELQSDDIFVDSRMLAEWFPIDLQVDIAGLQIQVIGREPLPIAEREARAEQHPPQRAAGRRPSLVAGRSGTLFRYWGGSSITTKVGSSAWSRSGMHC